MSGLLSLRVDQQEMGHPFSRMQCPTTRELVHTVLKKFSKPPSSASIARAMCHRRFRFDLALVSLLISSGTICPMASDRDAEGFQNMTPERTTAQEPRNS